MSKSKTISNEYNINIQIDNLIKTHDKAKYFNEKKESAKNGNINAQYNLALLYQNGEGTEKNLEKAFYWFQKAA